MIRLIKEKRQLTVCGILVLILLEVVHLHAEKHTGLKDRTKHRKSGKRCCKAGGNRCTEGHCRKGAQSKRQFGDLQLARDIAEIAEDSYRKRPPSRNPHQAGKKRSDLYKAMSKRFYKNYQDKQANSGFYAADDTGYGW